MAGKKLIKAEIVDNINSSTGVNRADVQKVVDTFFDEIKDALTNDMIVELRGFGTFEIRTRKGRANARNPKTGEIVPVESHGVAVFRPGKELKKLSWDLRK